MIIPTVEESFERIRARGIDIASQILSERGMVFRGAETAADADDITENDVERFVAEEDFEAAAATLLQTQNFIDKDRARDFAEMLCKGGDDYFYDDFDCEGALQTFQLAAALAPEHHRAVRGVIMVCLQGDGERKLDIALPYAVISAHLGGKNDLEYVLKLMASQ
jgi:hypothetical protein